MLPISEGPIVMKKKLSSLIIICTLLSGSVLAEQLEVSAMFGQMYSSDLTTLLVILRLVSLGKKVSMVKVKYS